jgi:hypothetical protein
VILLEEQESGLVLCCCWWCTSVRRRGSCQWGGCSLVLLLSSMETELNSLKGFKRKRHSFECAINWCALN